MIRITIELLVHGSENNKKTLGVAEIWNNLGGNLSSGNYNFRIFRKGSERIVWKKGEINGFPRKRLNAWHLLYRCLKEVIEN